MRRTTTTLAGLLAVVVLAGLLGGTAMAAPGAGLEAPGASQVELGAGGGADEPLPPAAGEGERYDSSLPAGAIVGIVFSIIIGALVLVLSLGYILPKPPGR